MLLFHGGFNIEQVEKLKNRERTIYEKMTDYQTERIVSIGKNTFDFLAEEEQSLEHKEKIHRISKEVYTRQYIFFFKYLRNALSFCANVDKTNYILVADIPSAILRNAIGIGKYPHEGYKIEYAISLVQEFDFDWVVDFIFYEPMVITDEIREYKSGFASNIENGIALKVLSRMNKYCKYL